ncbi:MAG: wax ester/triacylglycerol synthase family O-acyltransferase [Myxococcales bacterium]|nr:MAG: wax ester/triacylglycerol synthase family O-acyltransferase [Myxococcales bacterium]
MASERMSPVDTAWLHMDEPENPADIVTLLTFDDRLSYDALKSVIEERLLKYDRFKQRVTEADGHPTWEDDPEFHIERHVMRYELDAPLTSDTLSRVVTDLANEDLSPDRPLWAMHLIEGSDGGSAIVSRLHHCIADGFALAHAMLTLTDRADGTPMSETLQPAEQGEHEPLLDVLVHEAAEVARHPSHAVDLAKQGAALALSLGHLLFVPFDRRTVLKKELSGRRRMAWSSGLDLETIKWIGHSRGATVNDVLLSAMTGALRRFLADAGEPVDEFTIRAIIPVNLRPVHSIEEMDDSMGNRFGLVFLDLPVNEKTTEARFRGLKERMDAMKGTPEAFVAFGILNALGHTSATIEHIVNDVFGRKASLVVTNVPGPREPLYIDGVRLRDVMTWVPHPARLGLGLAILSYAGKVIVGVRVDEAVSNNPAHLVTLFEDEVSGMLDKAKASY